MKLRNVLIVVKDIEKSKKFYHDLFGLDTILDNDGNAILTEGLVLQDEKIWKSFLEKEGFQISCTLQGLGELPSIRDIFLRHVRAGSAQLTR